jgi:hypothetical protein
MKIIFVYFFIFLISRETADYLPNQQNLIQGDWCLVKRARSSQHVAQFYSNGNNTVIGPGVVLKVMAGGCDVSKKKCKILSARYTGNCGNSGEE